MSPDMFHIIAQKACFVAMTAPENSSCVEALLGAMLKALIRPEFLASPAAGPDVKEFTGVMKRSMP